MLSDTCTFDELNAFKIKVDSHKEQIIARYNNGEFTEEQYAGELGDVEIYMKLADKRMAELELEYELNAFECQSLEQ